MKRLLILALLCLAGQSAKTQLSCSGLITQTYGFTGSVQTFTVPADVTLIKIKTRGGSGGIAPTPTNTAGGGAVIEAEYTVSPGAVVTILVGGAGTNGNDLESGGGGATGVYIGGVLYIVAGGGGGEDNTGNGGNGLVGNNGGSTSGDSPSTCGCTSPNNGIGGVAGAGGNHGEIACPACTNGGGGGGGLNSAGQGNGNANAGRPGGQGNIAGAAGGLGSADDAVGTNGGWGWASGGGADDRESGGGGGYSGGGGGPEGFNPGGGGSFLRAGFTASFTANGTGTTTPVNGSVQICYFSVLPVSLLSFSGVRQDGYNLIRWKTTEEYNLLKFQVERSTDRINFSVAGEVMPLNSTAGSNYEFRDYAVTAGNKYFYRLNILNADGSSRFSPIIAITPAGVQEKLIVYPNPVTDRLVINSSAPLVKLEIADMTGRVLYTTKKINLTDPVQTKNWAAGTYIIKAYTERETIVSKFVKL